MIAHEIFIPANWFLITAAVVALILAILLLFFRLKRPGQAPRRGSRLAVLLRLAGFGALSLGLILLALMLFVNLEAVRNETAPAPSEVELPAGLPFEVEEVTFPGGDGIRLAGWHARPGGEVAYNGSEIILLHGYGSNRASMLWQAETLTAAGYGVILYDERASGESGGERRSYGWEDWPDVGGAAAFVREKNGGRPVRIGIAGCSIGAQIALQGAIHYPEIEAVWADGPSNLRAADNPPARNVLSGMVGASNSLLDFLYELRLGMAAPAPMIEQIGQIAPRPVMLVGGGREVGLLGSEAERVQRYAAFAGENAQVWVIAEAVHCDGPVVAEEEYARRLVEFFDAALRDDGRNDD